MHPERAAGEIHRGIDWLEAQGSMKTAIMTDTNSGIGAQEAQRLGVFVLPMPVMIDGVSYLESAEIEVAQLYEAMKQGRSVSTSQPAPGSVEEMWQAILDAGCDEVVYIPMSSGLSGSCQSARLLAGEWGSRVEVVDNHRISMTQRGAVLEAKAMADAGMPAAEIRAQLEADAFEASIYLTVDSLAHLQRGGRLSQTEALLGTVLGIKPILTIQGERIEAVEKVRGMKNAYE